METVVIIFVSVIFGACILWLIYALIAMILNRNKRRL